MIRRSRRVLPATLVALVVLAICLLVAVSCVQGLTGQRPWLPLAAVVDLAAGLTAASLLVQAVAVVLAVLGVALLVAALAPGAATVLPLQPGRSGLVSSITRSSLGTALTVAAGGVDGVGKARVRVAPRRVTAVVRTPLRDPGRLDEQVRAAIERRLVDIAPTRSPRIHVRVSSRSD